MKKALKALLNAMDALAEEHGELSDTDVREQMAEAVSLGWIRPQVGYVLPQTFGMFTDDGNAKVRAILETFLRQAQEEGAGLATWEQRLRAFQDQDVESRDGSTVDDYFGYDDVLDEGP